MGIQVLPGLGATTKKPCVPVEHLDFDSNRLLRWRAPEKSLA